MICSKCGASNPSDVQFCTSCGAAMARPNNRPGGPDPAKKRRAIVLAAAALCILALILVLAVSFSGSGASHAADDLCDTVLALDLNKALDMLPPAVREYVSEDLGLSDAKVRIISTESLDAAAVKDIDELYGMYFDTDEGYVEEAALVYVDIVLPNRSLTEDYIPLMMICVGGEWYLDLPGTADIIGEAGWDLDVFSFLH